jgi:hypothetical protein
VLNTLRQPILVNNVYLFLTSHIVLYQTEMKVVRKEYNHEKSALIESLESFAMDFCVCIKHIFKTVVKNTDCMLLVNCKYRFLQLATIGEYTVKNTF